MTLLKNKKILVTGGDGFLGKFVVEELKRKGAKKITVPEYPTIDLTRLADCKKVVKNQDIVIHLAAKVGGIGFNRDKPGELYYDNLMMSTQLMDEARKAGVKKYVALATVCSYPKFTPVPFKESSLWQGYPEETNAPYGIAKLVQVVQSQAYRNQYGFNSIVLFPLNLYGPGDNFDPQSSHVIPALIRKIYEAKLAGDNHIVLWGTGKATRGFLYVEDAAQGIVKAAKHYDQSEPVNLGSPIEISMLDLAKLIMKLVGYKGGIVFDKSKPDGQPRRGLDVTKAKKEFGFVAPTSFERGLKNTIDWYAKNRRSIIGS
ncbi:GDP-L-fucose synthase [Candidatus Berkelbacteria bacterium]|nr:GDP-L-fucose synthase [Candidatus Berkelbacteria bacterium]